MKKTLALTLAAAMTLSLAACASPGTFGGLISPSLLSLSAAP